MTGPRSFSARLASSAPSCDPDTNTMRSEDRSGLGCVFSSSSSRRDSITGTTTSAVALFFSMSASTVAGLKRRRNTSVEPSIIAMVACRKPSAWNIGAGSEVISLALNGTCDSTPPIGASDGGVLRLAPLGVPVVPLVRMMIDECLVTLGACSELLRAIRSAMVSSVLPDGSSLSGLVGQRAQLAELGIGLRDGGGVLVVVDDDFRALAFGDLFDLRPGELAVQQDDAGAGAGGAVHRGQEPPVVAGQDRDPVAPLDAHRP